MRITLAWTRLAGLGLLRPLPAGLVSHCPLDGDLLDAGPAGNHGTMLGAPAPTFVDGFDDTAGGAVSFDGARDPVAVSYTRPPLTPDATTLGAVVRAAPSHFFAGEIDEPRIYNYVLAEAEVETLFGEGPSASCCPEEGDTHCLLLEVAGPAGNLPGTYTAAATATDGSGDPVLYTFTASNPVVDPPQVVGPQEDSTAAFELAEGTWTIAVVVDDDADCEDVAADQRCTKQALVVPPGVGPFRRGDANADDLVDLSDAVAIFGWLSLGAAAPPCIAAANANGEAEVSITSGVSLLSFLFLGGADPIAPFPLCGRSTLEVDRRLGCRSFPPCP